MKNRDLIRDAMMFAVKDITGRVLREATVQSMIDDFEKQLKLIDDVVPKCLNCRYWSKETNILEEHYDTNIYGICNKAEDENEKIMDAICSSEGIRGELITRQDFGCVIFNKLNK